MKKIILLFCVLLTGCTGTKIVEKTVYRDTTFTVLPPLITETIDGTYEDGFLQGMALRSNGRDTVIVARVDTLRRKIYLRVQPDTVRINYRDTTLLTKYVKEIEETPLLSKLGLILIGLAVGGAFFLAYKRM